MGNTGYKFFESLELYYTDDNSYAGVTKANISTDPDYIAPFLDTNSCPPATRYYNEIQTLTVAKNDCSSGYTGSEVTLTANANQFVSTISQVDANNQAIAWLNANAQVYANSLGTCILNVFPVTQSVIFENQDSSWSSCKSASSADYIHITNEPIGSGLSNSTFYLNRYRGIIDTSGITTRPISAKIRFKFNTNTIGNALTMHLYASNTIISLNQTIQVSDWNDWSSDTYIGNVIIPSNSTSYNEILLSSTQLDLLYSEQLFDFFIISNGDKNDLEPSTNNRPELSILQSTGEVYLECDFGNGVNYYNQTKTLTVTKNDCTSGYTGSEVTLTANANQFVSTISQADADAQAETWLNENAQVYANNMGQCVLNSVNFEIDWGWQNYNNNSGTFQYKVEKNTGSGWEILLDRDDTIYTYTGGYSDLIQSTIPSNALVRVSGAITQTATMGDSLYLINSTKIKHNNAEEDIIIHEIDQNFGIDGSYTFEYTVNLSDYEIVQDDLLSVYINVDFGN